MDPSLGTPSTCGTAKRGFAAKAYRKKEGPWLRLGAFSFWLIPKTPRRALNGKPACCGRRAFLYVTIQVRARAKTFAVFTAAKHCNQ
jgi:hypothetical protein